MIPRLNRQMRAAQQILRLLERQRQALLSAQVAEAADLGKRVEVAVETLAPIDGKEHDGFRQALSRIQSRAEQNSRLATSARRGLTEAGRILGALDQARGRLGTYSDSGVRQEIAEVTATRDRRT